MDNIDIFNNSAIILENKLPKRIKSWITVLILLLIFFIPISFVNFNTYKMYYGVYKNNQITVYSNNFPLNKKLYINGKKYNYEILNINDEKVILNIKLDNNLKFENNALYLNVLESRTNLFSLFKRKWKEVFYSERNK